MTVPNPGNASERDLWGGTVTCVVPTRSVMAQRARVRLRDNSHVSVMFGSCTLGEAKMVDVSDIRQVPDNQEVFMDAEANQTIIFEIVEHDTTVPDQECGRYMFEDLASENEAESWVLESLTTLGPAEAPYMPVAAYMCLVRGRQLIRQGYELKDTDVLLAVLRFPWVECDLIISVCTPVAAPELRVQASTIMAEVLSSLQILSWQVFEGGNH